MNKPTVLLAHNYYKFQGGEDVVFSAEKELLQSHGHTVIEYLDFNNRIDKMSVIDAARQTIWSSETYEKIKKLCKSAKPDIAHLHNTFMLISPSVYDALLELDIPIVQTLHNYRLLCPNATFFRNSQPCEDCLSWKIPVPGIIHKCYRNSHLQTAVVATMLTYHRLINTWQKKVDIYIALTEFAHRKFIKGGLPAEKIITKPNFVPDPGLLERHGEYVVCVSRLSVDKGTDTLLEAWRAVEAIPLKIIGDGPQLEQTRLFIAHEHLDSVELMGQLSHPRVIELIGTARFLVFPTHLYETFGRVIIEAYAAGIPVIASRIGAVAELVQHGETGLLFNPGDSIDLAAKVEWLWNHLEESIRMGRNARKEYEQKYTPERNYEMLMDIYQRALENQA